MSDRETTRFHNAEIRWYPAAPGTNDASDMYVIDLLGVQVLIRKRAIKDAEPGDRRTDTYVHIETTEGAAVEINNGGENEIGGG